MDTVDKYRQIVKQLLSEYAALPHSYGDIEDETLFDNEADRYLIVSVGWREKRRVYGTVIHIDIIDGKVWIQCNNTDQPIAQELVDAGVAKEDIVLAFHPPELRPHTGYAVA